MKKLFPETADVPQSVANRAMRIVEKHLRLAKVDRAKDLPEEAKVRLLNDLKAFYTAEMSEGGTGAGSTERKSWLTKLMERIENFLSFGAAA